MSVVRIKRHRERFTVLSTATLRTAALSLKARGLWALCLSYPDDWEFRTGHLQAQSERDGRESVQSALKELETAGLASLETLRGKGGRVRGKRWTIYEEPSLNPSVSEDGGETGEDGGQEAESEGTDEPETRSSVVEGADERETPSSVETGGHRSTGFPSDGSPERRENRRTANSPLRNTQQHERPTSRKNEQQARARASGQVPPSRVTPLRRVVSDAAVALHEGDGGDADDGVALLVRRGVEARVAAELAEVHGEESVRRAVALYDVRRRGPKPPAGPGWLVAALRRGFARETPTLASPLLSHGEMLRWCEANGGLHRTAEFEPVRQPGQPVLFRRCSAPPDQNAPERSASPLTVGEVPAQTR